MAVVRRAGASRLIDWTGERCVPWTDDVQVAYEHYHRYLWAATLTAGRRVLDLGSGEGFGSAILAAEAETVQGIDIDERTVAHSTLNYGASNLEFRVGSALALEAFDDDAFDVVVSFEVIEHLVDQERMLAEIDRVLAPDGLLIVSTPERRVYSEATGQENPYHERELSEPEFRALLATRFDHVGLWGQRTLCGSRLHALDPRAGERPLTVFLERSGDEWREAGEPIPMYLVAVASRVQVEMPPAESTLVDHSIQLVRRHEREAALARADLADARHVLAARTQEVGVLSSAARLADQRHHAELTAITRQLSAAVADVGRLDARLATDRAKVERIEGSVAWSGFQFLRWQLYGRIGEHSPAARALQRALRGIGRLRSRRDASPLPPAPIRLPLYGDPIVSIVITAHVGASLTEACLRAIASNTDGPPYEVIVVDDIGDDENRRLWDLVDGARVVVNDVNRGYLRSVNIGADLARGRYVLPLNNDTLVQPGWLTALVERAENAPDVGIVAPKLIYPDGSLQEAGGIIFRDATGWNVGRGDDPGAPQFNYVRDVDYASGACLLVRADLWRAVGGYSERYLPMYYEDVDLCFAAREHGLRVVYEPAAHVVHVEGATAGTEPGTGAKRHQELNRPKFAERWAAELAEQLPSTPDNVRRGSDRNRGDHVLVVDYRVPAPDEDAGSVRMRHMLQCFAELGCRVTFIPHNLEPTQPYTRELQDLGIEVQYAPADPGMVIAGIGSELRLAVISRPIIAPLYLELVREHAPDATIAYDTVDLHFVREQRRAALGGHGTAKSRTLREIELGLVRGSDVTITVSDEERDVVLADVTEADVVVVSMAHEIAATVPAPGGRGGLLFVGSFDHPPNADAAIALVRTVMPLVWQEVGPVTLKIVGVRPPEGVVELAGPDVEVTGWVKDLSPLYDSARVMVAPLRYGAGVKGKVTQSLAAGLPVVTTPVGAEGLDAVDGRDMMIAEDPADIALRIVALLRDDELWSTLSSAGQRLAERVCSPTIMRERLEDLLDRSLAPR